MWTPPVGPTRHHPDFHEVNQIEGNVPFTIEANLGGAFEPLVLKTKLCCLKMAFATS